MKNRTEIKDVYKNLSEYDKKPVLVCGYIRTLRDSKSLGFIELNDGSCFKNVQIIFEAAVVENYIEIARLNVGSAITVSGRVLLTPQNKQPFEIAADSIIVEGESSPDYPLQKKRHTNEYLRTIAHLRPRTNTYSAVFRVRSAASYALHKFFNEHNFVYVHTPIITSGDCEGAGEMFHVKTGEEEFFSTPVGLTVSGQLNAECFALAYSKVYTFGPAFRAEKSNTPRHAAEFWMLEPEISFADLNDDMDLAEEMLKYAIKYILESCPDEMEFFNKFVDASLFERLTNVISSDFGRVTYTEAIDILQKSSVNFEYPVNWGCDLQTEHERYLTEVVYKKPVFVTDYPKDIKAFYMRLNDDEKTVAAMDLLVPAVGELIGGSQREERLSFLQDRMNELSLNEEDYRWYLQLREYGSVKHAGFGLGFERLIMYISGISNIRDVIAFPRTVGNADF